MHSTDHILLNTAQALTSCESVNRRKRSKKPPKKRSVPKVRKENVSLNESTMAYLKGFQDGMRLSLEARSASKQPSRSTSQKTTKQNTSAERCTSLHKFIPESLCQLDKFSKPRSHLGTPHRTHKLFHNSTPYSTLSSKPQSPCHRTMGTTKARTELILHKMKVKKIKALFNELRPQDGILTRESVQVSGLQSNVKSLLRPVLLEIVEVGITMDFEEFFNRVQGLLNSLSHSEQQTFFASSKRKVSQETFTFQPNTKKKKLKTRRPSKKSAR